jgi:hypothetical protein
VPFSCMIIGMLGLQPMAFVPLDEVEVEAAVVVSGGRLLPSSKPTFLAFSIPMC